MLKTSRLRTKMMKPARLMAVGFVAVITLGTVVLMLPVSSADGAATGFVTAVFTATSAVCVTGLVVVDTADHWSHFGEIVILALIQIGGLGVMTLATLLGLVVARRVGLRMQMATQQETKAIGFGDARRVVFGVLRVSLIVEVVVAAILATRMATAYGEDVPRAVYHGVFHSISAFNNAGFALYPDSLTRYVSDGWIIVPITAAFIIGGLGFPVLFELWRAGRVTLSDFGTGRRSIRPRFSLHTKITLTTYGALAMVGVLAVTASEWTNPATLGHLGVHAKILAGSFAGLSPRTAGFNSIDVGQMSSGSLLFTDVLMFIGGGSAGTAGGIKVATFALLGYVIVSEIRGEPSVHAMGRRIGQDVQRQAITVVLLGVGAVMVVTLLLLYTTGFSLDQVLFESVSAFGTVGLSTGITASIPDSGQLAIVVLMLLGRIGPITLASSLALRERPRLFERPEERPIVG